MTSDGKSTRSGASRSEKPKGVESDSFPIPNEPTGTSCVSSGLTICDPPSKEAKGETSISFDLVKLSGKAGVSSGVSIGVTTLKTPSCLTTGVSSGVRGKAVVSPGAKGKTIVSDRDAEVISFKDVKFGPNEGELRFRLIHFWEARNVETKLLIGLEMILIDQEETASVILVTTLNPKHFAGALALSSMASSRVFLDDDVQATRDYLTWLKSNLNVASRVEARVVTKAETMTIGEIFSYMKQEAAKVAWFECIATIGDVVHGSVWYYICCGGCHTKATKGPTTLMCKKCGKYDITGVAQYLAKISVYDSKDQAVFVLLGDAGEELTGKKASVLVETYFEENENVAVDHMVPVPQALIDVIGQTRKFVVKVSTHNLEGKTQSLTVTKVLPREEPELQGSLDKAVTTPDDGPSACDKTNGDKMKRSANMVEVDESKQAKCG